MSTKMQTGIVKINEAQAASRATIPVSLNMNVRGMGLSATLRIKEKCRILESEGRGIFDFGLGQSPFPVPALMVEALRGAAMEKDYLPVKGLPELREAIAEFHRKRDHINAQADRVMVGPGSKELMFILQLAYYGEIILPTPCWVSYLPQAKIIGRRNSMIHRTWDDGWSLSAEQLYEALQYTHDEHRPRLLILNYPNNPTGDSYDTEELVELAEVARKFEVIVLSDEIYGPLSFDGRHVSIARFYPEGTIVSSGISKWCGAGGWRLGTFVFPPELEWLAEGMASIASETYTSVSAPIQFGAIPAFQGRPEIERYLLHVRRILAGLGKRFASILIEAGVHVEYPKGAFYLFPDFTPIADNLASRGIRSGQALCNRLLEDTGVALIPGSAFGRSRAELTARISYVDFDGAAALAGSEETPLNNPLPDGFIEHHCCRVIEGASRIAEWIRSR